MSFNNIKYRERVNLDHTKYFTLPCNNIKTTKAFATVSCACAQNWDTNPKRDMHKMRDYPLHRVMDMNTLKLSVFEWTCLYLVNVEQIDNIGCYGREQRSVVESLFLHILDPDVRVTSQHRIVLWYNHILFSKWYKLRRSNYTLQIMR